MAIYGFARLVDQIGDEVAGDRLALLDAFEADLEPRLRRRAGAPAPAPPPADGARVRAAARAVPAADRGEPARPGRASRTRRSRSSPATATSRRTRSASSCCTSSAPRRPSGSRSRTRSAPALQLVEHWQDVAEDFRSGRIYLPAEDLARFGVAPADLGAAHAGGALRALLAFEVARARRLLDEGAPLVGTLRGRARVAVAGYVGGGLRERRRDRGAPATTSSPGRRGRPKRAGVARRSLRTLGRRRPRRRRVRGVPADRARRPDRASTPGCGCSRPTGATRSSPSTRSRGGSTTSPTATSPDGEKLARLAAIRGELARLDESRRPGARRRRRRRAPVPDPARGVRRPRRRRRDGRARRRSTRRSPSSSSTAAASPARSAGSRSASSTLRPRARPTGSPTTSASRSRSGTSCATSARTCPAGRVYLPREDLERFGCEVRDGRIEGPAELLVAFEAQRGLEWLDRGLGLVPLLDRRSATCVLAMAGEYRRLLERIAAEPSSCSRGRPSLRGVGEGAGARPQRSPGSR